MEDEEPSTPPPPRASPGPGVGRSSGPEELLPPSSWSERDWEGARVTPLASTSTPRTRRVASQPLDLSASPIHTPSVSPLSRPAVSSDAAVDTRGGLSQGAVFLPVAKGPGSRLAHSPLSRRGGGDSSRRAAVDPTTAYEKPRAHAAAAAPPLSDSPMAAFRPIRAATTSAVETTGTFARHAQGGFRASARQRAAAATIAESPVSKQSPTGAFRFARAATTGGAVEAAGARGMRKPVSSAASALRRGRALSGGSVVERSSSPASAASRERPRRAGSRPGEYRAASTNDVGQSRRRHQSPGPSGPTGRSVSASDVRRRPPPGGRSRTLSSSSSSSQSPPSSSPALSLGAEPVVARRRSPPPKRPARSRSTTRPSQSPVHNVDAPRPVEAPLAAPAASPPTAAVSSPALIPGPLHGVVAGGTPLSGLTGAASPPPVTGVSGGGTAGASATSGLRLATYTVPLADDSARPPQVPPPPPQTTDMMALQDNPRSSKTTSSPSSVYALAEFSRRSSVSSTASSTLSSSSPRAPKPVLADPSQHTMEAITLMAQAAIKESSRVIARLHSLTPQQPLMIAPPDLKEGGMPSLPSPTLDHLAILEDPGAAPRPGPTAPGNNTSPGHSRSQTSPRRHFFPSGPPPPTTYKPQQPPGSPHRSPPRTRPPGATAPGPAGTPSPAPGAVCQEQDTPSVVQAAEAPIAPPRDAASTKGGESTDAKAAAAAQASSAGTRCDAGRAPRKSKTISFSTVQVQEYEQQVVKDEQGGYYLTLDWKPALRTEHSVTSFDLEREANGRTGDFTDLEPVDIKSLIRSGGVNVICNELAEQSKTAGGRWWGVGHHPHLLSYQTHCPRHSRATMHRTPCSPHSWCESDAGR